MVIICKQATHEIPEHKTELSSLNEDGIFCALCNHLITDPGKQIVVNQSFRHIFANPHGYVFEIACFSIANGCKSASIESSEFTWFPGFSWRIGICGQCSSHLGWIFSSDTKTFFGLIVEKIIFP